MATKKTVFLLILLLIVCLVILYYMTKDVTLARPFPVHLVFESSSPVMENDAGQLATQYFHRWEDLKVYNNNYAATICKPKDAGPCVNATCNATFPALHTRLQRIFNTQYTVSDIHLDLMKSLGAQVPPADLIFLTAASQNHFEESQGVIKDLHEKVFPWLENYTNYTYRFIFYNLGLNRKSATMTVKHCRCHVLSFPFQSLDSVFGHLKTYKWKPLIVKAHMEHSKILIYMDASVRFVMGNIQGLIQRAMADGIVISRDGLMLPAHVMPPMLEYFRVEPCLLGPFYETEANFFMVKNELLMNKALIDPWTSCAFAPRCIYPGDNWLSLLPCAVKNGGYSRCHRFDQAALGVLLVMLFDWKSTQLVERNGIIQIRRDHKVKYFPEQ